MKQTAKAAVVRVIHDLILADGILDTREMELLSTLYAEYGAKPVDYCRPMSAPWPKP